MDVLLPKWGVTMQEATLERQLVRPGAVVAKGDPIAELGTDKVEVQLEAPVAGRLVRWNFQEGDTVPVGACVAVVSEA